MWVEHFFQLPPDISELLVEAPAGKRSTAATACVRTDLSEVGAQRPETGTREALFARGGHLSIIMTAGQLPWEA